MRERAIVGKGSPSGWRKASSALRRSPRNALNPVTPKVARMPPILLTIDLRSPIMSSRSRWARRASSSASRGIGTIEHTRGSPRKKASSVRSSISTSITSVFARRALRSTGRLDDCITWTSTPRRARNRASQNPSRPASKVKITRATALPEVVARAFNFSISAINSSPFAESI